MLKRIYWNKNSMENNNGFVFFKKKIVIKYHNLINNLNMVNICEDVWYIYIYIYF